MDSSANFTAADIEGLTAEHKQELSQFIKSEQSRAQIHQRTHEFTELCFKKCVTGAIKNNTLDKKEESCLANCVDRFMDANLLCVQHLTSKRQ